jgi:hypothetical protein
LNLFPPTHPPTTPPLSPTVPHRPTHLYIWNSKVNFSPSTYSPINLKCATLIPIHLPALPPTYLPNPTYMATPTYMVATTIDPQWSTTMRKE